jgi:hypothetical protein
MRETQADRYRQAAARRIAARPSCAPARSSTARYKARRHAKTHAPILTRSRLRTFVACLALAALYACVTFVNRSPLFAIRHVRITGLAALLPGEAAQAQAASVIPPGTNFFHLDRKKLETALKGVPALAEARISPRFPNSVDIVVTPREPVAVLAAGELRWEVDRSGVAIRPERSAEQLPEIACSSAANVAAGQRIDVPGVAGALSAAAFCASNAHGKPLSVAKIEVDQNGDMCLNMVDNVAIRIGQNDQLDTKLSLVRRIYNERPDIGAEVESIDLRFPEAPACLPRGTKKQGRDSSRASAAAAAGDPEHGPEADSAGTAINSYLEPTSSGDPEHADSERTGRQRRGRSQRADSHSERRDEPRVDLAEPRR